jgi:hypothetical protein
MEVDLTKDKFIRGEASDMTPDGKTSQAMGFNAPPPPKQTQEPQRTFQDLSKIQPRDTAKYYKHDTITSANPLTEYFRSPEYFLRLPSNGVYNSADSFELAIDGTLAIYPMTAADELALKNPEGILSGASMESIIKSCAPGIKNPRTLTISDYDAVLLAIRSVSIDNQLDFEVKCPSCEKTSSYGIDINYLLENATILEKKPDPLVIKNLSVDMIPFNFDSFVKLTQISFEEERFRRAIEAMEISDEEKLMKGSESFKRLINLKTSLYTNSIEKIQILDKDITVDKKEFIEEFLNKTDAGTVDAIEENLKKLNDTGVNKKVNVTCKHCSHEHEVIIDTDITSFFIKPSERKIHRK